MAVPRGKIKPFCAACGAVGQMTYVATAEIKAIKCDPCGAFYANHEQIWAAMKDHPNFEAHVGADGARMVAAEKKREMRIAKRIQQVVNANGKPKGLTNL